MRADSEIGGDCLCLCRNKVWGEKIAGYPGRTHFPIDLPCDRNDTLPFVLFLQVKSLRQAAAFRKKANKNGHLCAILSTMSSYQS